MPNDGAIERGEIIVRGGPLAFERVPIDDATLFFAGERTYGYVLSYDAAGVCLGIQYHRELSLEQLRERYGIAA